MADRTRSAALQACGVSSICITFLLILTPMFASRLDIFSFLLSERRAVFGKLCAFLKQMTCDFSDEKKLDVLKLAKKNQAFYAHLFLFRSL